MEPLNTILCFSKPLPDGMGATYASIGEQMLFLALPCEHIKGDCEIYAVSAANEYFI
jgi:hypothetical protein